MTNDKQTAESADRLTEAEWEQRRARRECSAYGHDWDIIQTFAGPTSLICTRPCGDPGYAVVRTPPASCGRCSECQRGQACTREPLLPPEQLLRPAVPHGSDQHLHGDWLIDNDKCPHETCDLRYPPGQMGSPS